MSDFKSFPVDFLFHFRSVSCLTSGPYVWSSLCFSQVPSQELNFELATYCTLNSTMNEYAMLASAAIGLFLF